MRKPKNNQNQLKISHFERLPDKAVMPEYFNEIKNPIDMFIIKVSESLFMQYACITIYTESIKKTRRLFWKNLIKGNYYSL